MEKRVKYLTKMVQCDVKKDDYGRVGVYGLGNNQPIVMYRDQWKVLLDDENVDKILDFIDSHLSSLVDRPLRICVVIPPSPGKTPNK